jgi:hypothetical protein
MSVAGFELRNEQLVAGVDEVGRESLHCMMCV